MKSLIFHAIIIVMVSGAFIFKDDIVEVTETPIEIAFVDQNTAVTPQKTSVPIEEEPPAPPAEDKPQPAPQALEQPDLEPKPIEKKKEVTEKIEKIVERVKPEEVAPKPVPKKPKETAKPKPEPEEEKPVEVEKPKENPKPKPEPEEEKPEEPKTKDTKTGLDNLLKNLAETQPQDSDRDGPKLTEAPVNQPVTAGELNALNRQISRCWSLLPGAAQADTLAVNLTISVNQDRTVRDVQIADKSRYSSDPYFRAAADNAIRAIKHRDCTPLDLPQNKYNEWKVIDMNFDPHNMF